MNRNIYADFLKGTLILLVIFGHCIQEFSYLRGNRFAADVCQQLIYGFHMPLFFAISGYFAYSSVRKYGIKDFIINRLLLLIIPFVVFVVIITLCENQWGNTSHIQILKTFIGNLTGRFWFVKQLAELLVLLYILNNMKIDKPMFVIGISIFLLLLPSNSAISIGKYLLFFYVGYWLHNENLKKYYSWCKKHIWLFLLSAAGLFTVNRYSFIKIHLWDGGHSIPLIGILFAIVLCISVAVCLFVCMDKYIPQKFTNTVAQIGTQTLAIYLIQGLFFDLHYAFFPSVLFFKRNTCLHVFTTIILTVLIWLVIQLLSRNNITRYLLLGKK